LYSLDGVAPISTWFRVGLELKDNVRLAFLFEILGILWRYWAFGLRAKSRKCLSTAERLDFCVDSIYK
jgi:hypothetical protein